MKEGENRTTEGQIQRREAEKGDDFNYCIGAVWK